MMAVDMIELTDGGSIGGDQKIRGAIEAILFSSGDPVSLDRIAQVLELDKATAEKLVQSTMDHFNVDDGGLRIARLGNNYQMCTNHEYAELVRQALDLRRNTPLSQAGMEVLAIVAYNQPVTKAFVEQVRGVDCSGVIGSLTAKGLLEEKGRLELPGRPLLYGTTPDFYAAWGFPPWMSFRVCRRTRATRRKLSKTKTKSGRGFMTVVIVLGIVLAVIALLLFSSVRVEVVFTDQLLLTVTISFYQASCFPPQEQKRSGKSHCRLKKEEEPEDKAGKLKELLKG